MYKDLLKKVRQYQKGRDDFMYGIEGLSVYTKINIGKGMYILIGGQSGSGKTSFSDTAFILNPFMSLPDNPPLWLYRSMERDKESKLAKWTCNIIYRKHGVLLDVPTLLSLPSKKRKLNNRDFRLLEEIETTMDALDSRVIMVDGTPSAEEIRQWELKIAYQKGKLITADDKYFYINGEKEGTLNEIDEANGMKRRYYAGKAGRIYEHGETYIANNPKEIVMPVFDHIGKILDGEGNQNTKKAVDAHSSNQAWARDILKWTPIDISQFNRDSQSTQRNMRLDLDIQEKDFKNSATPYENADLVLGLINPWKLGHSRYQKINVKRMVADGGENRLRLLKIVKNSYGSDDIKLPLVFLGENGHIMDFPEEPGDYDYEQVIGINI